MKEHSGVIYLNRKPIASGEFKFTEDKDSSPSIKDEKGFRNTIELDWTYVSPKTKRTIDKLKQEHRRKMLQISTLFNNPKHLKSILRCKKYNNKIPRKYKRLYKDIIRTVCITPYGICF